MIRDGADRLCCIATDGNDPDAPPDWPKWEHVSVSVRNRRGVPLRRCPAWEQMCIVKDLFWDAEETVIQFHPPRSQHVNFHNYCLHQWRPVGAVIALPPPIFVGPLEAIEQP